MPEGEEESLVTVSSVSSVGAQKTSGSSLEDCVTVTEETRSSPVQADTCIPKLNEGDQIVLINGRDISEHTHDQVVMFIKASRESHTRELALVIRRKGNSHPRGRSRSKEGLPQPVPWFCDVALVANMGKSRAFP